MSPSTGRNGEQDAEAVELAREEAARRIAIRSERRTGMKARKYEGSRSDFIREQPDSLSTSAVIAAGKQVGLKITENLVRIVRYKMRKAAGTVTKRGRRKGTDAIQVAPAQATKTRRGRPPKNPPVATDADPTGMPFDKVGSRLPLPELASSARDADSFCRLITRIGTTKARALLDELEK